MFRMTSSAPCEIAGTIRVHKPITGLGIIEDIHGERWHVEAIIGGTVCACPASKVHPYFTDTSGASFGLVQQTWLPYDVEVVE